MNANISPTLSPPWYTLRNEIAAVLTSTHVSVGQLDTSHLPYVVPVAVDDKAIAAAVVSILPKQWTLGNITMVPVVTFNMQPVQPVVPTSPEQLMALIQTAFKGNALLSNVVIRPIVPTAPPAVFPVFTAEVVQFFNDDLSDLYQNFNGVLANCAKSVLAAAPGGFSLVPSTAQIRAFMSEEQRELAEVQI